MRKQLLFSCVISVIMLYSVSGQIYDTVSYPNLNDSITIDWGKLGVSDSAVVKSIKQLTTNEYDDIVQCWGTNPFSKDGTKIVYTSAIESSSSSDKELVMMNANGSDKVRLTMNDYCNSHASFTPDGQSLVYQAEIDVTGNGNEKARIFIAPLSSMIAEPDSNWGINLIDVEGPAFDDTLSCFLKPMISNDGSKIAFMKDDDGDTISGIFVMNINGTAVVHISDTLNEPTHHSWSPDGEWVTFQSCSNNGTKAQIFISKADGSTKPILVSPMEYDTAGFCSNWPAYSPDGKWISYHIDSSDYNSIILYNVKDESTRILVSNDSLRICAPTSWSPDSKWLTFKRAPEVSSDNRDICMINIDTDEEIILTTGYRDYRQWFNPGGNSILFKDYPYSTTQSRDSGDYDYDLLMISFEIDLISPIVITKDISIEMTTSCTYDIVAADVDNGSWDNVDIVSSTIDISSFDCDDIGNVIEVTLTLEDAAGNISTGTSLVTVLQAPVSSVANTSDKNLFSMYPNPANDQLYINTSCTSDLTISVYDNSGRLVIIETIDNDQALDVSQLESGMYTIQVASSDFTKAQKLIIAR